MFCSKYLQETLTGVLTISLHHCFSSLLMNQKQKECVWSFGTVFEYKLEGGKSLEMKLCRQAEGRS